MDRWTDPYGIGLLLNIFYPKVARPLHAQSFGNSGVLVASHKEGGVDNNLWRKEMP